MRRLTERSMRSTSRLYDHFEASYSHSSEQYIFYQKAEKSSIYSKICHRPVIVKEENGCKHVQKGILPPASTLSFGENE
jgi:hypothetical protein